MDTKAERQAKRSGRKRKTAVRTGPDLLIAGGRLSVLSRAEPQRIHEASLTLLAQLVVVSDRMKFVLGISNGVSACEAGCSLSRGFGD